ncbi:conserved hypothetical protein [Coccidioides posadasii str. Silveira]|uniref:Uncharacterized protein n=1 Tax=Coccidioides posadasii (strain RMSCC 757 / Silveira) TaxID=443226 RepID=E9DCW8_COCPS|nr:conserved hypothetical protein [Coccidioides posadasii str. Silveira]
MIAVPREGRVWVPAWRRSATGIFRGEEEEEEEEESEWTTDSPRKSTLSAMPMIQETARRLLDESYDHPSPDSCRFIKILILKIIKLNYKKKKAPEN